MFCGVWISVLVKLLLERCLEIFLNCDFSRLGHFLWALFYKIKIIFGLLKYVRTTSYFCTIWRLFIKFLDCTLTLASQWYDSHNDWAWFYRLSGSYYCFPFSPDMFWWWVKTLFYLRKLSPEVKSFCSALAYRPYMKQCQQTFAGSAFTSHQVLTSFATSSCVILLQLFYIVLEDSNSDLLFCDRRIFPHCMSNPLPFLLPADLRRECIFNVINVTVHLYEILFQNRENC